MRGCDFGGNWFLDLRQLLSSHILIQSPKEIIGEIFYLLAYVVGITGGRNQDEFHAEHSSLVLDADAEIISHLFIRPEFIEEGFIDVILEQLSDQE